MKPATSWERKNKEISKQKEITHIRDRKKQE